jgi:hypothetical protein
LASLFTSQTPSGPNNSDGSPGITVGTTMRFAIAGSVTAVRFYAPTTATGTWTGALWRADTSDVPGPGTGTLLGSKVLAGSPTGGTWNLITFDSPVPVLANTLYRVGVHSSEGRYVNTSNFFTADVVNGNITADANNEDPTGLGALLQGTFLINATIGYPTQSFNSACYFADVDFTGGGDLTPPSVPTGLAASAITATTATLSWSASSDNTAVTGYEVQVIGL